MSIELTSWQSRPCHTWRTFSRERELSEIECEFSYVMNTKLSFDNLIKSGLYTAKASWLRESGDVFQRTFASRHFAPHEMSRCIRNQKPEDPVDVDLDKLTWHQPNPNACYTGIWRYPLRISHLHLPFLRFYLLPNFKTASNPMGWGDEFLQTTTTRMALWDFSKSLWCFKLLHAANQLGIDMH